VVDIIGPAWLTSWSLGVHIVAKTILLFIGGLAFICFGLWFGLGEQIFLWSSATTSGKITSKPEMYIHNARRSVYPRYRFHYKYTVENRSFEAYEGAADDTSEPLTVYYNKKNPSDCRITEPEPSLGYKFAGMGLFFTSISALSYYREKKRAA
jgi:hypothetical protein